jgi:endonuclease YncB( thermonuclease family)
VKELWHWPVAKLVEVHDGDTVKLEVDNGFGSRAVEWIRLAGVRAPDPGTPDFTQEDYDRAKNDCETWFATYAPDRYVSLETERTTNPIEIRFRQSFTRYIGWIGTQKPGPQGLNAYLINQGWRDRGL